MNDVKQLYIKAYEGWKSVANGSYSKYDFVARHVFDLTTYDDELNEEFVKKIIEVSKAIITRQTFEYIAESHENYIVFILVCNLFEYFEWINWGTSVRGSWFEDSRFADRCFDYYDKRPILSETLPCNHGEEPEVVVVPFTGQNLRALIEFVEEEE